MASVGVVWGATRVQSRGLASVQAAAGAGRGPGAVAGARATAARPRGGLRHNRGVGSCERYMNINMSKERNRGRSERLHITGDGTWLTHVI